MVDPDRCQHWVRELGNVTMQCGSPGSSWMNMTPLGAEALVLSMATQVYEAEVMILVQNQHRQLVAGMVV